MNELTNVDMNQKQQLPEHLERGVEPAHSKDKLIISSLKFNKVRALAAGTAKRPLKQNSATTDAIQSNINPPGAIGQAQIPDTDTQSKQTEIKIKGEVMNSNDTKTKNNNEPKQTFETLEDARDTINERTENRMHSKETYELEMLENVWDMAEEALLEFGILLYGEDLPSWGDETNDAVHWINLKNMILHMMKAILKAKGLFDPEKDRENYCVESAWKTVCKGYEGDNKVPYILALNSLNNEGCGPLVRQAYKKLSKRSKYYSQPFGNNIEVIKLLQPQPQGPHYK